MTAVQIVGLGASIILAAYALQLCFYLYGWLKLKEYKGTGTPTVSVSVIIAARNEEQHIGRCIDQLIAQELGASVYEIIIVDDHSEDGTARIVEEKAMQYSFITLLRMEEGSGGKKAALKKGIERAGGELLVFTDADCEVGKYWLYSIACFYEQTQARLLLLPVVMKGRGLQALEFFSLTAVTAASAGAGGPLLCNGAGLAYPKSTFTALNGFEGNENIASGDDMLLLQKMKKKDRAAIHFLLNRNAIVETPPAGSVKAFFDQRIRWASKTKHYSDQSAVLTALLVFLASAVPAGLTLWGLFSGVGKLVWYGVELLIFKVIFDFLFLFLPAVFFKRTHLLILFLPLQILYPFYVITIGLSSFTGSYRWKGRRHRI